MEARALAGWAAWTPGLGGAAGLSDAGDSAVTDAGPPADKLSQTGLYQDIKTNTLAADVEEYQPAHVLWTDGATKRRFFYLPKGTQIDTSDMDYWQYPIGTKAWKEFTRDGKRIETRLLHKVGADNWQVMAYIWLDDGSDAVAAPLGQDNAKGTQHDVPGIAACENCHGKMPDQLLGVSAIQLSHNLGGLNLDQLSKNGKLTVPPKAAFFLPGSKTEQQALGYLHANCGNCHNDRSFVFTTVAMRLWLDTASLGSVAQTPTYKTTVNKPVTSATPTKNSYRIVPGKAAESDLYFRIGQRGTLVQMPPLGTELVDKQGLATIESFIANLK